jgi:eukaryotic-like serine/threonine-protein kinase
VAPIPSHRTEVSPELDEAVRVALERDPDARYGSALEMAEAIEAGMRGEATEATQRLGMSDLDMTQAIDQTAATRAMQRTTVGPNPTRVQQAAPPAPVEDARARRAELEVARRAARRRRWGTFLALLAAIAALAIVAIALLSSSGNGGVEPVQRPDVQQQIDALRDFIQSHTR